MLCAANCEEDHALGYCHKLNNAADRGRYVVSADASMSRAYRLFRTMGPAAHVRLRAAAEGERPGLQQNAFAAVPSST